MPKQQAEISTVNSLTGGGSAAHKLMAGGLNANALRTNAVLRKDEWQELDTRLVEVARERLNGIADLRDNGLTIALGGLGTTVSQYEALSDMTEANLNMSGVTPGQQDDVEFDLRSVPVPIIHKDFSLNIRRLEASRRLGDSVDLTTAEVAMRRVADGEELLLFNGSNITVEGGQIHGYTTHPNRITGTAVGPFSDIGNIDPTFVDIIRQMQEDFQFGPYMFYVATDVYNLMQQRYEDGSGERAYEAVERLRGVDQVKPADVLEPGTIVAVNMSRNTVDLAVAQDMQTLEWDSYGGMQFNFKVMSAMAPRIKADQNGRLGVAHFTGAGPAENND